MSYHEVLALGLQLSGSEADDVILGTSLDDSIQGEDGDDTLAGGPGDDFLEGGEGNDTYIFAHGDGYDWVSEWDDTPGESDTVRLSGGILPTDVQVTRDLSNYYLVLDEDDLLVLDSMARESAAEIERIEFDDGTVWTDLAARVELLPGTQRNDVLWGTPQGDVIHGLGGEDELFGNGGDDFLAGGEGIDIYVFAPGDGTDVVDNYDEDGSPDQIAFISAASAEATVTRRGNDLVLTVESGGNEISLRAWYSDANRKIDSVFFGGDFVSWDAAMLEELAPAGGANNAPEVVNPLADQAALEDEVFSFSIPQSSFADADADELAYSANLLDGANLPAWLSFDPELQRFSGTPANGDVGVLEITVTATDAAGEATSDSFTLEVVNANDAPVVAGVIADVQGREGEALAFHVSPQIFTDPDANDHLSLSAAMASGSALPGWLSFDGTSFRGAPGPSDAGEYVIEVTASDDAGATAETSFRLMVEDTPAPNLLLGTRHKDVLKGTAAEELLVGLGGNDELRGGMGNDVYVHGRRDGHDEIVEAGGDFDLIRFDEGITRDMVRARRHRDDLVLDVAGPHGSVTVTGWFGFAGAACRVRPVRRRRRMGRGNHSPAGAQRRWRRRHGSLRRFTRRARNHASVQRQRRSSGPGRLVSEPRPECRGDLAAAVGAHPFRLRHAAARAGLQAGGARCAGNRAPVGSRAQLRERARVRRRRERNPRVAGGRRKACRHLRRGIRLRSIDRRCTCTRKLACARGPYRRLPQALKSRAFRTQSAGSEPLRSPWLSFLRSNVRVNGAGRYARRRYSAARAGRPFHLELTEPHRL